MKKLAYLATLALLCTGLAFAQPSAKSHQNANNSTAAQQSKTNANRSNTATTPGSANANQSNTKGAKKLPQTASPLPLLALLGTGMLGLGVLKPARNFLSR